MISDSIFTIHRFDIPVKCLDVPIYLIPFGDIHRYAPLCDARKWLEFVDWAKKQKNAYFLGMGDYDDLASTTERKALLIATLHESTQISLDELYTMRVNNLLKEIMFMKGRIIGLVEGNHHSVLQSGMTSTQMMCDKLKCKYLGVSTFIRLRFPFAGKSRKTYTLDIFAHHGRGASRLTGGSLNTVEQMAAIADADIYLMGHDHRKSAAIKTRLVLGDTKLHQKKVLLARTGSFLRGYVEDQPSYVARNAMIPTDLGVICIELTPKRDQKKDDDDYYVDIHTSL